MAKPDLNNGAEEARKERRIPAVSAVLGDGTILETVADPEAKRTSFVLEREGECIFSPIPFPSTRRRASSRTPAQ
jgi:hypothetical protein